MWNWLFQSPSRGPNSIWGRKPNSTWLAFGCTSNCQSVLGGNPGLRFMFHLQILHWKTVQPTTCWQSPMYLDYCCAVTTGINLAHIASGNTPIRFSTRFKWIKSAPNWSRLCSLQSNERKSLVVVGQAISVRLIKNAISGHLAGLKWYRSLQILGTWSSPARLQPHLWRTGMGHWRSPDALLPAKLRTATAGKRPAPIWRASRMCQIWKSLWWQRNKNMKILYGVKKNVHLNEFIWYIKYYESYLLIQPYWYDTTKWVYGPRDRLIWHNDSCHKLELQN